MLNTLPDNNKRCKSLKKQTGYGENPQNIKMMKIELWNKFNRNNIRIIGDPESQE